MRKWLTTVTLIFKASISCILIWSVLPVKVLAEPHIIEATNTVIYNSIDNNIDKNNSAPHDIPQTNSFANPITTNRNKPNKIIISDFYKNETETLEEQFVKTFIKKISDDDDWQCFANPPGLPDYGENQLPITDHYLSYYNDREDEESVKRDVAFRAACGAFTDVFKQTPLGKDLIKLEQVISQSLVIEYSKGLSNDDTEFYLPGQMPLDRAEEKKAYRISLSPVLYADTDTLNGHFSLKLGMDCYNILTETIYDFSEQELTCDIENNNLNDYLGMKLSFSLMYDKYNETNGLLFKVSLDF